MKNRIIFFGILTTVIILLLVGAYKLMNSRTVQLFGGLTAEVNTDKKVVALTFDDGPTNKVEDILPILEKHDAKATFFLIGNEIEKNPEAAQMIARAGHQIGNHTYSHKRMVLKSPSFIKEEIQKTNKLILKAGYKGEIDFRPPNGKKLLVLPYYLNQQNIQTITWNLEPDSYYTKSSDKINYVKKNVKPGSIILLHPMYDKKGEELKTLEGILKTLSTEGYRFITVNELQEM
ncbi:polysaccharide deacetylase family protein [Mesobacillus selenatarsenatis]|uniref:Polysaccharide deacetylase, possible chitooligosaccharide deacetylase n=1 Tax=Mesobacillus selenatarsenatis (strain DSM 18680 / JCM 14380 / FERM P-15431 / SF-1) TaxID=1321606 RepID=A0A0A8X392_MESS1|nr:polysaccharide deacetylase family protein [Mesobacillus selenatarsenatis]GAM14415.1 polysaccharide deacetylase, possible chitooligosaccharide deacetylase [Mesobacillus selenatarsenatis SF-1]